MATVPSYTRRNDDGQYPIQHQLPHQYDWIKPEINKDRKMTLVQGVVGGTTNVKKDVEASSLVPFWLTTLSQSGDFIGK